MDEQGRIIDNSIIGEVGVIVKPFVHIKNSIIRNGCLIESFTQINGSEIGENTRIMGHVFIPAGIFIDRGCFIGPGVIFTNRKYPGKYSFKKEVTENRVTKDWVSVIKENVTIGAGAVIGSGIVIGEGSYIGMGATVTKDVPPKSLVYGNPARREDLDDWGAPKVVKKNE